jgi:hypothetical protein
MTKRAVDLSTEVLAALGARAARAAAQNAQKSGLIVTGTIDMYQNGQAKSSLAQLHPSGTVTIVHKSDQTSTDQTSSKEKLPLAKKDPQ